MQRYRKGIHMVNLTTLDFINASKEAERLDDSAALDFELIATAYECTFEEVANADDYDFAKMQAEINRQTTDGYEPTINEAGTEVTLKLKKPIGKRKNVTLKRPTARIRLGIPATNALERSAHENLTDGRD